MLDKIGDVANITELQGMLWIGLGALTPNMPSTLNGIFEITYSSFSSNLSTEVSNYKKPLGGNFINYIDNKPIIFTLNGVQFKNVFTGKFDLGLTQDNFGFILIQTLSILQRKFPLFVTTSHYSGPVILTGANFSANGIESGATLNFEQAELFREFDSVTFQGEVKEKESASKVLASSI